MFEEKLNAIDCGIVLSESYKNSYEPHKFRCNKGHTFLEQPSRLLTYVKQGKEGCIACREEGRKTEARESYKATIKKLGFRCKGYVDSKTPITHICEYEHEFSIEPNRIHTGLQCPFCLTENQKRRLSDFTAVYKSVGWEITAWDRKPSSSTITVTVTCLDNCGTEKTINLGRALYKCGCTKAANRKERERVKLSVNNKASKSERIAAFNSVVATKFPHIKVLGKYENSYTPIKLKCDKGHKWETKPANLLASKIGCPKCGVAHRTSGLRKTHADYAMQCAVATHGILKPVEDYITDSTAIKHQCGCGRITKITPNAILNGNYKKCPDCFGKKGCSAYSVKSCRWLDLVAHTFGIKIKHALNGKEKQIALPSGKIKVDGYCKGSKTVYEFLGDAWHGSPFEKHEQGSSRHPHKTKSDAKLLYDVMKRFHELTDRGYNVVWVWETAYAKGQLISGTMNAIER